MSQAYFIAGTDTDVGKTTIAAGLLHAARQHGLSTLAAKPVASGCVVTPKGLRNSDALALIDESSIKLPYEQVNPFAFEPAIAPHIAAREAGVALNVPTLLQPCAMCWHRMPISPWSKVLGDGVCRFRAKPTCRTWRLP